MALLLRRLPTSPPVRAAARAHARLLLARGDTWEVVHRGLVDAAVSRATVCFERWSGSADEELLYWEPFVRWAVESLPFGAGRVTVLTELPPEWYTPAVRVLPPDADPGAEVRVRVAAPAELWSAYRRGETPIRPLLKHAIRAPLAVTPSASESESESRTIALDLSPTAAFPATPANVEHAAQLHRLAAAGGPVTVLEPSQPLAVRAAVIAGASAYIGALGNLTALAPRLGTPSLALTAVDGTIDEADVAVAFRSARDLGTPFAVVGTDQLEALLLDATAPT